MHMKSIIISCTLAFLLLGCKGRDENLIKHVVVNYDYYPANNYSSNYDVDLDRNGDDDLNVEIVFEDNSYIDGNGNVVTITNHVIYLGATENGKLELMAEDDCANLIPFDTKINEDDNWEENVTLSNDYPVPCNPIMNADESYLGFKLEVDGDIHYGWTKVDFNITNSVLTFEEWAIHNGKNKEIKAGEVD